MLFANGRRTSAYLHTKLVGAPFIAWRASLDFYDHKAVSIARDEYVYNLCYQAIEVLDIETGKPLDTIPFDGNQITCTPTISEGIIYFGVDQEALTAVELSSKQERWRFPLDKRTPVNPVVYDGLIYFGTYNRSYPHPRSGYFHAVDVESGREQWRLGPEEVGFTGAASASSGVVCLCSQGKLHVVDAQSGVLRWAKKGGFSPPVIGEGVVYGGYDQETLFALRLETGEEVWRVPIEVTQTSRTPITTALWKDILYVGGAHQYFYALDAKSGEKIWQASGRFAQAPGFDPSLTYYYPIVTDDVVCCMDHDTYLYGFDRLSGELRWAIPTQISQPLPFTASGDTLVLMGNRLNILQAVRLNTTSEEPAIQWQHPELTSDESLLARIRFFRQIGFFQQYRELSDEEVLEQIRNARGRDYFESKLLKSNQLGADHIVLEYDSMRVASFDTEIVYEGSEGYKNAFLLALAHISQGNFAPQNVTEHWSQGDSSVYITFELHGQEYEYIHKNRWNDYVDLDMLGFLNKLVADTGYQFYMSNSYQYEYFLMLNQEEYDRLTKERGWELLDMLEDDE